MTIPLKAELPGLRLAWLAWVEPVTPPEQAQTFLRYNIYRREPPETAWVRIGIVEVQSTAAYTDYAVRSGAVYEYTVTVTVTVNATTPEGVKQAAPARGRALFDGNFLHDANEATEYAQVPSYQVQVEQQQDMQFQRVWGRTAPTAQVGEVIANHVTISGLPDAYRREQWRDIVALTARQRDVAAMLCLRLGRAQTLMFCQVAGAGRALGQKSYDPSIELQEVYYNEAVEVSA